MNPVEAFNSLKVSQKLVLIVLSFFLPIAVLLFQVIKGINYDINFSTLEFYGDKYQRPLEKLLKEIPEHGIVAKEYLLNPNETSKAKLQKIQKKVDDAIGALREVDKELGVTLQFTDEGLGKRKREQFRVETLASGWTALKGTPLDKLSIDVSDQRHKQLKEHIRTMITHMGDTSNLILDPDLDSYYNMDVTLLALPQTQDRLSEIIGHGLTVLAAPKKDTLTSEERIQFAVYAAQLKEVDLNRVLTSIQTALNEDANFLGVDPQFQRLIPPARDQYKVKTEAFIKLLESMVSEPKIPVSIDRFLDIGMAARDESFSLWEKCVEGQDSLLTIRIKSFQKDLVTYLIWGSISLVFSMFLAFAITRSITKPLQLVVRSLKAQASMDFSRKIHLARSDELGEMALGMNQVVDALRAAIQRIVSSSNSLSSSSHTLAAASVDLSKNVENSPFLMDIVGTAKGAAKEVAKNAAELQQLAKQFKLG